MLDKSASMWGSHMYLLLPALTYTGGSILEIGVGHYSSLLCNMFSLYSGRHYMMVEEDRNWLNEMRVALPKNPHREMVIAKFEDSISYRDTHWDIAVVDGPDKPERRLKVITGPVKDCANYVVVHDTQLTTRVNKYRKAIEANYKYYYHFDHAFPGTSIASNFKDVSWIKAYTETYKEGPND